MEEEEEGEEAEVMEGVGMKEETSQPKRRAVTQEKEPGGKMAISVEVPMVHNEDNTEGWPKVGGECNRNHSKSKERSKG